jgi:hypothetical protein
VLGKEPLVFCGLLGADVDDDDVQLAHDLGSSFALVPILTARPALVNRQ